MVTTDEDEPPVVGAVAQFGGQVQEVVREVTSKVTYGKPGLLLPLVLIALLYVPILAAPEAWQRGLGVFLLLGLTVWSVVTVTREKT